MRPLACWDCCFESRHRHVCLSVVIAVRVLVQVSVLGLTLIQRGPTECEVSECDLGTSTMERSRATRAVESHEQKELPGEFFWAISLHSKEYQIV